ncbi:MAG: hypothetical protein PHV28_01955 [Kiritimatiellae bacterium]|nr:hypothetical protein [Kiritimatiellia bacterium]
MKEFVFGIFATLCAAAVCAADCGVCAEEKPYDFRARLADVHKPNRRDWKIQPTANEFAFTNGMKIAAGEDAAPLVRRAADDFRDYLLTSMGVNASVEVSGKSGKSDRCAVEVKIDGAMKAREYAIEVGAKGVTIRAADAKAAAQGFYRLEDRMNLCSTPFLAKGAETRRPMFSPRMSHSGWGCDQFPDAHLAQMAHHGIDAILIFVKDVDVTKNVPHIDISDTIRRAKAWGLDTYLYSYVLAFAHPSAPGSKELFEKTYGRVAAAYPEAKGIIFVGESCQFPSKDERALPYCYWEKDKIAVHRKKGDGRPLAGWFPCRDYPDWLNAVKAAIRAHAPDMEIVFWSYNWGSQGERERLELLNALPRDITLQATFEMFEAFPKRNGLPSRVADYSLTYVGPGRYFASEAKEAQKLGMRMYSMSNTGGHTWDFGTIPFDPFPYQWKKRFDAVVKAHVDWNLAGLMENHHYGWWPSFISELSKEAYTEGGMQFETHIRAIAARDYGEKSVDAALAVWKDWSEKIVDMHSESENQYGPFRYGPAYPFNAMEPDLNVSDLPMPPMYLNLNYRHCAAKDKSLRLQIELLDPMVESFMRGGDTFLALAAAETDATRRDNARRLGWHGQYMARACLTARNVKAAMLAERAKDRAKAVEIARDEYANAKAALKLVRADSRLGWEPTMLYRGGPDMIEWKLRYMEEHYGVGDK